MVADPDGGASGTGVVDAPAGSRGPRRPRLSRRGLLWAGGVLVLVTALVVALGLGDGGGNGQRAKPGPAPRAAAPTWLSGASGQGVTDGSFGAWRGSPVTIAATWVNTNQGMVDLWTLQPGAEFGDWDKPLDVSIGAIDEKQGETWAKAAQGAYDARWRQSLTNLRAVWGQRAATLYIRFAHEMNGNWFPWSVTSSSASDFVASWKRFRAMQQEIFPAAQLVFCVNRETNGLGMDWRKIFPGSQYVDVLAVDYYNNYPYADSEAAFRAGLDDLDAYGAPKGLQAHLDFARSVGLPLAVPEWSGDAKAGDSPAFVEGMHDFFAAHAGTGPGDVLYDILFNVTSDHPQYSLFGKTQMPESAEEYRRLF